MTLLKQINALLYKEITLEWRQKYALNGLLLYVVSVVFICYMSFNLKKGAITPIVWNVLFWIIMLFTAINSISKSFNQEREGRYFFYYVLASPTAIIFSKIIYNTLLMIGVSGLTFVFYSLVMGNPVIDTTLFLFCLVCGAVGFSSVLTMIAAIASKSNNNGTLMAVLGFPLVLPLLLMLIKISKNALDGLDRSVSYDELITILAINLIVVTVSQLLFPYLWRS
jgi:heme exporter protein B